MSNVARLVFHEDGSITTHEVVEGEHMEFLYDDRVCNPEQCTAIMEAFMSVILEKPIKLQVLGTPKVEKPGKDIHFELIGNSIPIFHLRKR